LEEILLSLLRSSPFSSLVSSKLFYSFPIPPTIPSIPSVSGQLLLCSEHRFGATVFFESGHAVLLTFFRPFSPFLASVAFQNRTDPHVWSPTDQGSNSRLVRPPRMKSFILFESGGARAEHRVYAPWREGESKGKEEHPPSSPPGVRLPLNRDTSLDRFLLLSPK